MKYFLADFIGSGITDAPLNSEVSVDVNNTPSLEFSILKAITNT